MKRRCAIMQRVLSVILCATLLIGLFPVIALASSEDLKTVEVTCDKPSLDIGQTAQLSVTLLDGLSDAYSGAADITYTSINPYVATVDQNGLVTARNYGLTKITVTAQSSSNTVSKTVTVAVEEQRDGVVTFESMEAGAAPQGMALSNLATVSDYNGCNSSQSAYLNDNSDMDTAYMHYQIPAGAMELTLDFDVYVESGVVSLALTNGDSTPSANKAFYIKFGQDKTEMYNGSGWAGLKDESGNPAPPKTVKNSVWSHVHIEIINTDAVNGSAKIYVDGEYIGTAAKTIYGGYGRNTGGALDGVYLSSSDNTSIADRCYIDNLTLKPGLTPVGQAEVPLLDVKLGAKVDLAWNTERILDDYGNDLGDPNNPGHIDDIVNDYEDGFGFCQIPFGTVTIPNASGDRVFMPYSRSRDGGTTISLDGHKVFETDTILNAADGDDLSQEYLVMRNIKFQSMVAMNDGSGRYFAITYLGRYIDNSTASIGSMIYDPATDEWTNFSGTMHIDSAITGITGPMGSSGFPLVFVKVAYSADGDKLLVAAYGTNGDCYMFESDDLGKNWNYRSTIASPKTGEFYHPNGTRVKTFFEPSLERCSDGSLLCLMRTTDYQPLWQVRSLDDGLTWGTPERLPGADGVGSIYPVTVKLDNGVLAASTGRFGNTVLFSLDGCGYRWGYATATYWTNDVTTSSGNCSVARIAPNTLLQTGDYGHQVQNRLAGIWGRVVEVERNDRPNPELSGAILKTDNNRLMVGESLSVRVEGIFNSNGYLIPADQCEIKYYSESPEILAVDEATGEAAVLNEGLTRVIASVSHDGKTILTNSVAVTAINENTLNSFTFTVDDWSLDVGQSASIAASAFNETGAPITSGVSYAFHSANPDIVSVDAGGVVTGVSSGLAVITITATKNNISVSNKTTVIVNSDKWEVSDFENCDVGGALPDGYKLLTGNVLPSVSDANAYGSDKSLHFYDSSTSAPASLMRNFTSRTAAVLEFMFYPVKSAGGLWLGMGSGAAAKYLSNISFTDSPGKPGKMRLGYRIASGWVYPVTDLPYNQWYKIRLEGCIGMPSKLFIDDTFICNVGAFPISGGVTLTDLTYVYFMAGSNAGTGDECYIDDIKLMTFDNNTLDSVTATMDDWTLDVGQEEQVTVHAYNELGDLLDTDVSYTFQSENPGIASVDASGIVTGVSPGVTEIWATAVKGFTSVASKTTVVINSSLWETSDFEDCEVGGALPDGYTALISLRPSVSDGNAYSDDKSLRFYDDSTSAPASLMRNFTADKAAVVEYMFYPVKSANGLWLGMGSGAAGRYLSNICFTDSPGKPGKMRLGYNGPSGWVYPVTDLTYNQWYKIRLEGCIGKPSKLFIDDQFICEVGAFPLAASITLADLTYVYFMAGSNGGTGDECYIDDIKLMSFDAAAGANLKLSELTFDGETLPGFNPDVIEYDITLPEKKKGGIFEAVAANPASIVNIQTVGDDLVTITVSNGGYEQRYVVNITWQLVEPVDLSSPLYVETEVGIAPVLPDTVEVIYSDGTTSPAAVTWEAIAESKYAEAGTFTVEGVVEGTSLKATAVVTVKADNEVVIESIEGVSVETEVGIAPVLPDTVEVTYSDGTTSPAAVTWEAVAESKYAEAGTFIVEGTVEGTDIKATAHVTVTEEDEANSTISPTSATFDKYKPADIEVTMTLNGNMLSAVKNGDVVLVKDKDYIVNGTMVVLKKEYVSALTGDTSQLTFVFSAGDTQEFTINIINTNPGGSTEGGSGTTPTPSEPTPIPVKNQDGSASITLNPAVPAGSSTAQAKVDNKLLDKAFELAEADKDGIKEVNLKVAEAAGAETYSVELTVGKLAKDTKNQVINIETPVGTISVNEDMLEGTKEAEDAKVCLNIKKVEGLEGAEGRPVVEITATISGKVIEWNNPDSPVTISIPYKPSAEELKYPEHITVWYIDGNNKITAVPSGRYDPATGMVTFKATHFSKYAVAYVKNTFGDIKKYPWAVHSVEVLASKGVIEGVEKDSFKPDQAITRGEYLMWLVKALGLSVRFNSNFDDVAKSDSYYEAIGVAKEIGITVGVGGNKFAPSAKITRQELMALTAKALKAAGHELKDGSPKDIEKFGDASKVAKSFVNAVAAMVKSGIIVGNGKNINPGQNTTRAEAAVILYKLYSKSLE